MSQSRREFLRRAGCLLGSAALASGMESFGLIGALAQSNTAADYRALVCIFLNGGNDGNNTIIPLDAEFASYSSVRGASGLALAQASLLPITPPGTGRQFGLHPNLSPEVAAPTTNGTPTPRGLLDLWNQGKLAVLCNTGPLVEPLTRDTYRSGGGRRPYQLFSHSDQVAQWQNAFSGGRSETGWGGRTADRTGGLNGAATFPQVVSVAGISLFVTGADTRPLSISDSRTSLSQVLPLTMSGSSAEVAARRAAFDQLRALDLGATLVKASSDTTSQAIQTSRALANADATLVTSFPDTNLGWQLEQVARLVKLRDLPQLGVKRQIFFCSVGGFDTHNNQRGANGTTQDTLLAQVSQAMRAFYDATVELGVQNQVVTFTLSDFGRTLQPAGAGASVGSDHAWGNHQLVMGGAVRGGDFYGKFPTLALGGPDDTDNRGRWIPTTSVEQYAATLAAWYGLSSSDMPYVFPLLGRFPSANLGFLS